MELIVIHSTFISTKCFLVTLYDSRNEDIQNYENKNHVKSIEKHKREPRPACILSIFLVVLEQNNIVSTYKIRTDLFCCFGWDRIP